MCEVLSCIYFIVYILWARNSEIFVLLRLREKNNLLVLAIQSFAVSYIKEDRLIQNESLLYT